MARKMLIDATHPEETRVVVVNGNKVEEFDFDTTSSGLITGNIYLAKISRIEPSLQAAFVDYGGNRHGFLAFSEIHPDYFQIPQADREAILKEEMEAQQDEEEDDEEDIQEAPQPTKSRVRRRRAPALKVDSSTEADESLEQTEPAQNETVEEALIENTQPEESPIETTEGEDTEKPVKKRTSRVRRKSAKTEDEASISSDLIENSTAESEPAPQDDSSADDTEQKAADETAEEPKAAQKTRSRTRRSRSRKAPEEAQNQDSVDQNTSVSTEPATIEDIAGNDDEIEIIREQDHKPRIQRLRIHDRYKIQEVVKTRQIILVQVIKEERGNKGAALTTYLSLPGRYCVLMPNTARGGGISRKISNIADRRRLKTLAKSFNVPKGAGLIIRTAGAAQDSEEIGRDYEFLTRQWNQIRDLTLKSTAPAVVYAETGPIKRAIRDLLTPNCDEILIEGQEAFDEASEYMNIIMPDRMKMVKAYKDSMPLFSRYQVETHLNSMFNPTVQLPSGGYLVIGVTEALIAIDVNSGRSTKGANVEETAHKTNLEAAEEVARQLKLRDLAGLIVIDFIDMEQRRHQQEVENKLKDALRKDRARIQVGRISNFGLLEMSRQRLRTGLVEAITTPCPHCLGTGIQRSDDNVALSVIRAIEEEIARGRSNEVIARVPMNIANYLFNEKRDHILGFETRMGVTVKIIADPEQISPNFQLEKNKVEGKPLPQKVSPIQLEETDETAQGAAAKRRRRRGGRGRNKPQNMTSENGAELNETMTEAAEVLAPSNEAVDSENAPIAESAPKPRRARRTRKKVETPNEEQVSTDDVSSEATTVEAEGKPVNAARKSRTRKPKAITAAEVSVTVESEALPAEAVSAEETTPKPKRAPRRKKAEVEIVAEPAEASQDKPSRGREKKVETPEVETPPAPISEAQSQPAEEEKPKPKRRGWWSLS